jgi:hypothetical protein
MAGAITAIRFALTKTVRASPRHRARHERCLSFIVAVAAGVDEDIERRARTRALQLNAVVAIAHQLPHARHCLGPPIDHRDLKAAPEALLDDGAPDEARP